MIPRRQQSQNTMREETTAVHSETPIALRPRGIRGGYTGCARCAAAGLWADLRRADPSLAPGCYSGRLAVMDCEQASSFTMWTFDLSMWSIESGPGPWNVITRSAAKYKRFSS